MESIASFFSDNMYVKATFQTLYMTVVTTVFAYLIGIVISAFLFFTKRSTSRLVKAVNGVISWVVNIGRSIPFFILAMLLMGFTRFLMGTSVGTTATIIPLIIGSAPLVTRMLESSFEEISPGKIETAISMGADNSQVFFKLLIPESLPSIIRGFSISCISILGFTAVAGALGGGGLGQIAKSYGYERYETKVIVICVIILVVIVQVIQSVFNKLANIIDKRI